MKARDTYVLHKTNVFEVKERSSQPNESKIECISLINNKVPITDRLAVTHVTFVLVFSQAVGSTHATIDYYQLSYSVSPLRQKAKALQNEE